MIALGMFGADAVTNPLNIYDVINDGLAVFTHRGDAFRYPENTALAFTNALADGSILLEMDVHRLSGSTRLGVMHDDTVNRVTTSTGNTQDKTETNWNGLVVDTDSWHFGGYGNLSATYLDVVLAAHKESAFFFIEAKYLTGGESTAGQRIVDNLIAEAMPVTQAVVASFDPAQLAPAVAAGYPALIHEVAGSTEDIPTMQAAGITWAGPSLAQGDARVAEWVAAGFYTVVVATRHYDRDRAEALGCVAVLSNDTVYTKRTTPLATSDNFAAQTWQPGMIHPTEGTTWTTDQRGRFFSPASWGWDTFSDLRRFVLQGWGCPIKSDPNADSFTIDLKVMHNEDDGGGTPRWAGMFIADGSELDKPFNDGDEGDSASINGYLLLFRRNGTLDIYRRDTATLTLLATQASAAIAVGTTVRYRVIVSPTQIINRRLDAGGATVATATATDATYRGGYFHLGRRGLRCRFSEISIY